MAWVLIRQGLGRIVSDPVDEKRAIDLLMNIPICNWKWREETAAAAFLLSRSDSCPGLLKRDAVEKLGQHVISEFKQSYGSDYTKFQYVPSLLLGLLRWRLVSPRALIDGDDELASNMAKSVKDAQKDMLDRASSSEKLTKVAEKWIPFLDKILEEIRGEGGHLDLLATIYNLDD
ncbi:MAG: hypothetical protein IT544_04070 [Rhodobacteraceae bacterium]|nr:hypothetical protein [Paracoccaceae bacterium]